MMMTSPESARYGRFAGWRPASPRFAGRQAAASASGGRGGGGVWRGGGFWGGGGFWRGGGLCLSLADQVAERLVGGGRVRGQGGEQAGQVRAGDVAGQA